MTPDDPRDRQAGGTETREHDADWLASRLDELRETQERQSAAFAAREATLAAREATLVARVEERGRVIVELTAHLGLLTARREDDRHALERARQSIRVALARRSAAARRKAIALAVRSTADRPRVVRPPLAAGPATPLRPRKPRRVHAPDARLSA